MKKFKAMIKTMVSRGMETGEDTDTLYRHRGDSKFFQSLMKNTVSFVFNEDNPPESGVVIKRERDEPTDFPFAWVSFENASGPISNLYHGNGYIDCVLAVEYTTGQIHYYRHAYSTETNAWHVLCEFGLVDHGAELEVNHYLGLIDKLDVGKRKINERLSAKKPGNPKKKITVVKDFVYIVGKKETIKRSAPGEKIEWSHSWQVRGHWRKTMGIGKNSAGDYCVNGKTWVLPAVKGCGDLIKKQRVVNENLRT